ncbi:DUF2147 domain-containing protein [Methylobacterium sp. P1-11]|uniref:DUF2147 domain-containing protein n=1 Tax=Methylobacterium sp. P1-11 TaxID=2024616 RepID=UPI0011ECE3E4|nr:DUF2147 domain-containing protein [Methylobacterium sp. P1-11]KAA0114908.1 DUF2147 domain-containing protein [Methylobacterium sp. P1-11]
MTPIPIRFATGALIGLAASAGTLCNAAQAAEPFGTWQTEDGRDRIRIERGGSDHARLCGFVVWGKELLDENGKPKVDRYSPNPSKQGRPLLGHQLLSSLKQNAGGRFEGKIYSSDNGKSCEVTLWSNQPSALTIKGCMLAVFCGSQTWSRVMDAPPGQLQGATDAPGGPRSDSELGTKPAVGGAPANKGRSAAQPQ